MPLFRMLGTQSNTLNHPALMLARSPVVKADSYQAQLPSFFLSGPSPACVQLCCHPCVTLTPSVSVPKFLTGEGKVSQRPLYRLLFQDITDQNP